MSVVHYPRPKLLAEIPGDHHAVIEASAGTGKTYTIEHLIVDLLLGSGLEIDQILVVTFTEKATAELRARVRRLIAKLASLDRNEAEAGPGAWAIDEEGRRRLRTALARFDLAPIHTIHAFCRRVLEENAFSGRRAFEQELVDGRAFFGEVLRRVVRETFACEEPYRTLLRWWLARLRYTSLERDLYEVIRHRAEIRGASDPAGFVDAAERALAVVADAGFLENLAESVSEVKKQDGKSLHGATAKAMVRHLAALAEAAAGFAAPEDWFREAGSSKSIKDAVKYLQGKEDELDFGDAADEFGHLFTGIAVLDRLEANVTAAFREPARDAFEAEKQARAVFDFDDMLRLVDEGLAADTGHELAAALRRRYRVALIDEFQDTDRMQWRIFSRLFFDRGEGHRLFLVGDPKQAIYGFRGADVRTYLKARAEIREAGGAIGHLDANYRATAPMVTAVNALLATGDTAFFSGRDIDYDHPVTCGNPALAAEDERGDPATPVVLWRVEANPEDGKRKKGKERLGRAIAREIRDLVENRRLKFGERGDNGKSPAPIGYEDVFVLTRSRNECREMGEYLREVGVPFAFFGLADLFESDEACDLLAVLRAVEEPLNPSRRHRAFATPFFALTLTEIERARDPDLDDPLLARLFAWRELARRRAWHRFFPRLYDESGVIRREVFAGRGERRLTNYLHLGETLMEEGAHGRHDLAGLTALLASYVRGDGAPKGEDGAQQRLETDRHAVQVMTMHKCKGLEAPVVFLYGGFGPSRGETRVRYFHERDGLDAPRVAEVGSPSTDAAEILRREELEEGQRLLYVAVTRAAARLYLPWLEKRAGHSLTGNYLELNTRLGGWVERDEHEPHAEVRDVGPENVAPRGEPAPAAVAWTPPAELLAPLETADDFDALRADHAAFALSSYSRMKRARAGERAAAVELADPERSRAREAEPEPRVVDEGPREDALPGGVATGRFIHEVLEHVDFTRACDTDARAFGADPEVARLLEARARLHGIDARHLPEAARMVHAALTARLDLGGVSVDGLCRLDPTRVVKEMEFLYPIPERGHPRLGAEPSARGFEIERGFLRGFVDLVFEHEGRIWFADWKTDVLDDYRTAALDPYVGEHYGIQKTVYAVALARWLGARDAGEWERRFGGVFYAFLRGLGAAGAEPAGVWVSRPGWAEIEDEVEWLRRFHPYREARHGG